ncbi:hypothetical protein [Gordonia neofelifaecis]|uniref:Lipoprotein n=1 Tax=Gordonia neofelifaecis NRRL B-59395 TaxID=644548 RepID=F1YEA6_9ACTN|nr:hypothetical protein [Gordonia neofelifaecis]EGD56739.1 hypothetical protein SCNU_00135 [Gordonia neofelifaecis NRRL B-59395]
MRQRLLILAVSLAAAAALAGCGSPAADNASGPSTTEAVSPPTTGRPCSEGGTNTAEPSFYQDQFSTQAEPLSRDIATYRTAVTADDNQAIQDASSTLYSEITVGLTMAQNGSWGCYSPLALQDLETATNEVAPLFNDLDAAESECCGHTSAEAPALIEQITPKLADYINTLNAYSAQFGGEQV